MCMSKKQVISVDDSDIHKLKKYGVTTLYNVTIKYVKDKIEPGVVIHGE